MSQPHERPQVNCPRCGAPHPIKNPGVVMVQCEYCGELFAWNAEGIHSAGQQSLLVEGFTRLYRGAQGSIGQERFEVLGRVRYDFGQGFWDEWFLTMQSGQSAWLTEDDHQLAWQTPITWQFQASPEAYRPGQRLSVEGIEYVIHEVGHAKCLGVEGSLPRSIVPGHAYRYADATSPDGRFTLGLEFDDNPPSAYVGHWLAHEGLSLDDEGEIW